MADEYIRKADAVEETLKYIISSGVNNQSTWNECVRTIADTLQDMPSADVVPVVHGVWLDGYKMQTCSLCKCRGKKSWTFCPHCGAKMEEDNG